MPCTTGGFYYIHLTDVYEREREFIFLKSFCRNRKNYFCCLMNRKSCFYYWKNPSYFLRNYCYYCSDWEKN